MKLRPHKVFSLIWLPLLLAGLFLIFFYARAMKFIVVNRVTFVGQSRDLPEADKNQIRQLVMNQDWIKHPPNQLTHYLVQFDSQAQHEAINETWIRGDVYSNETKDRSGILAVTKRNGVWVVAVELGSQNSP